jgi:23S rRNA (cytosine1962-C5)-methyltransferase
MKPVWNLRGGKAAPFDEHFSFEEPGPFVGQESGLRFDVRPRHRGIDPLLFLDLRAGRRHLLRQAEDMEVLNLFAYTCGLGVAAARGGCRAVLNVDFAASALEVGQRNAELSGCAGSSFETVCADVLPTVRQLAGLPVKGRASRRRPYERFEPRQFDLVLLDPPAWAKSPFGAVDVVRDYPSLFKPALLATRPGGAMLVTNNFAAVDRGDWLGVLQRCAAKAARPIRDIQWLTPESDFPSPDGRPPLKMAWLQV